MASDALVALGALALVLGLIWAGARVLRVDAVHEDAPFPDRLTARVRSELADLARFLDVELLLPAG